MQHPQPNPSPSPHKHTLRTKALNQRDSLTASQRLPRCEAVCAELAALLDEELAHYKNVSAPGVCYRQPPFTLGLYHALGSEVCLASFAAYAYRLSCAVCFPCMSKHLQGKPFMAMREVSHEHYESCAVPFLESPLQSFELDDPQLAAFPLVDASLFDMVVVPIVAFDDKNNRLGYGGGNYDRFLPALRENARVVGVAFDEQRVAIVPCEPHDHALPRIIIG